MLKDFRSVDVLRVCLFGKDDILLAIRTVSEMLRKEKAAKKQLEE